MWVSMWVCDYFVCVQKPKVVSLAYPMYTKIKILSNKMETKKTNKNYTVELDIRESLVVFEDTNCTYFVYSTNRSH